MTKYEFREPTNRWRDLSCVIAGKGKVGKTAWLTRCDIDNKEGNPTALYIPFEQGYSNWRVILPPSLIRMQEALRTGKHNGKDLKPGLKALCENNQRYIKDYSVFEKILDECDKDLKAGDFPFDTIIIDDIDNMCEVIQKRALELVNQKYKNVQYDSLAEVPKSNGWAMRTMLFRYTLHRLQDLNCAVFYVSHKKMVEIEEPATVEIKEDDDGNVITTEIGSRKYSSEQLTLSGKEAEIMTDTVDTILSIKAREGADGKIIRSVNCRPKDGEVGGSRCSNIPEKFLLDESNIKSFDWFKELFDHE